MKQSSSWLIKTSSTLLCIIAMVITTEAQDIEWTGAINDDWDVAGNWNNGVPTASDIAAIIINNDTVIIKAGTAAFAKSLFVTGTNIVFILGGNASLNIGGTLANGLLNVSGNNSNKVIIEGNLQITDTGLDAIHNLDSMFIVYPGEIYIFDCNAHAINNAGYFYNDGKLDLENPVNAGFYNQGVFENDGDLFTDLGDIGIVNYGYFENNDSVVITSVFFSGIRNHGSLINYNNGVLIVDGITNNFGSCIINMVSADLFTNYGSIIAQNCGEDGIVSGDTVTNTGFIDISKSRVGINNDGAGNQALFENLLNGIINISDGSDASSSGIYTVGTFRNEAFININNTGDLGIINKDEFYNHDSIQIQNVEDSGILNEGGNFQNHAGAIISITNVLGIGSSGFRNFDSGNAINDGKLSIKDVSAAGLINENGTITNNDTILIENTTTQGLINEDSIYVSSLGYIGLSSIQGAIGIANFPSSTLEIDGDIFLGIALGIGIYNLGNIIIGPTGTLTTNTVTGDFLICKLNSTLDCQGHMQIE